MSSAPDPLPSLHFVVPGALDQRTGGYLYDARIVEGLRDRGRHVVVHSLSGRFPDPDPVGLESLAQILDRLPDGATTVVDGLALEALAPDMARHAARLRFVVLVHHLVSEEMGESDAPTPLRGRELAVLGSARGVIVTSAFTASRLEALGVEPGRVRVVEPGTERPHTVGQKTPRRGEVPERSDSPPTLLCVASITPRKGHDVLVAALSAIERLAWECVCAGSLDRDPDHAAHIRQLARSRNLGARIRFAGECGAEELEALYAEADVLVLASRFEGYGMALTEGMARGLPIVSTTAGAIPFTVPPEAGVLVPAGDADALAGALERLLGPDGWAVRAALAEGARRHAATLPDWPDSVGRFERALAELLGEAANARDPLHARDAADASETESESFPPEWLALREPADRRSRSTDLAATLADRWVAPSGAAPGPRVLTVVDLGAGTGSNTRWLAPRLPFDQRWILVDRTAAALAHAERHPPVVAPGSGRVTIETLVEDLSEGELSAVDEADLVTASALLDLVSEEWLRRLVDRIADSECPALFALTYDGTIAWSDEAPDDELIRTAVNEHQRRDKGFGPALGPEATLVATKLLREAGYEVTAAASPWRIGSDDTRLAAALIEGWRVAAGEQRPDARERIDAWAGLRSARVREGRLRLRVGHRDLLALPPD